MTKLSKLLKQKWPIIAGFFGLSTLYLVDMYVEPGWVSWLLALPAFVVVFLTAIARLDSMTIDDMSLRAQFKRLSMATAGSAAIAYAIAPFATPSLYPTWLMTGFAWSVAGAWITTPHQPPWWRLITGEPKPEEKDHAV